METDVHSTRDGVVVAIHDPDLSRTSERAGLIRDLTWSQLSAVRLTGTDEPVPRLDDLLAAWPEIRWNIDAKHESVVGPLIETIHRCGVLDRICATSFSDRRLARLRRACGPDLCTGMGPASTGALRLASVLGGRAPTAIAARMGAFGAAQVPVRHGRVTIVDPRFVATSHRLGVQVHVWTIDDPAVMGNLLDMGVDGIMTDRPSTLKQVLVQRGQWF